MIMIYEIVHNVHYTMHRHYRKHNSAILTRGKFCWLIWLWYVTVCRSDLLTLTLDRLTSIHNMARAGKYMCQVKGEARCCRVKIE